MKTKITIIGISLALMASTSFGQFLYTEILGQLPYSQVAYHPADNKAENKQIETRTLNFIVEDTISSNKSEFICEEQMGIDKWMTAPFQTGISEEQPLENWMKIPFSSTVVGKQIVLESWMSESWI